MAQQFYHPVGVKPNMRIIVLAGASHVGKTTTLNKLAKYILSQRGWKGGPNPPASVAKDEKYVLYNTRGIKVGISTEGDTSKCIHDGFSHFVANKCDVCFIASKTSGCSVAQVEIESYPLAPMYVFLHNEHVRNYRTRNRSHIQANVVSQLYSLI